jgi:hypothetical protein
VNVQVAFVLDPYHDQLIDVLRAMNELLIQISRAVPGLDDLLTVIQVYHSPGGIARIRDGFLGSAAVYP